MIMSAECRCPQCDAVSEYAEGDSQLVQCRNCGHVFLASIDKKSNPAEKPDSPGIGFYHACLIDTWKIFLRPHNYILIGLITAITVFKFFVTGQLGRIE